jgi:hypothetical protein
MVAGRIKANLFLKASGENSRSNDAGSGIYFHFARHKNTFRLCAALSKAIVGT